MWWLALSSSFVAVVASTRLIPNHTVPLLHSILDAEIHVVESLLGLYNQQARTLALSLPVAQPTSHPANLKAPPTAGLKTWQPLEPPLAEPRHGLDTVLVDKASHLFAPDVTALQLLSWRVHTAGRRRKLVDTDVETVDYLAVARTSGLLELRNPRTFELLWQLHTRITCITSIHQLAGTRSSLALVSSHGDVTVFTVRVLENGRLRIGEPQRDRTSDRPVCLVEAVDAPPKVFKWGEPQPKLTSSPPPVGLHVDMSRLFQTPRGPAFVGAKVLLVQVSYDIYVVVATTQGDLLIYTHGGICVHHVALHRPLAALVALLGGSIAFTLGTDVGILNVPQWDHPIQLCTGSTNDLNSLERDVHRPSILYAGTSAGTVLVLRLHRSFSQRQPRAACSIQQQLVPQDQPTLTGWGEVTARATHVQLASLKRLVFVVANRTFAGYQLVDTNVARRLFATDWNDRHNTTHTKLLVTRDKTHDALVVLSSRFANGSTLVVVHENLMVQDAPHYDVSWVRAPLMVIACHSL
ncbi:hypothetical protein DYB37_013453 [Aphanomyces astaci]|uniref:Uncharacterized protein n=1 Tax=Aphanomyces astaci TaxID=112090 RepID=A0A418CMQ2_APHAT|nr:hypothetical protein DYB35_009095 [Aphanomyces astaci]RHZ10141.1 hypothetical protein DYB37_013453 [Aphanomyces astaci]